ncbi:MAG: SUMF1/EgtB/PvdO family nonheme iron enzyme [Candidatus Pelagibacterales bacterium]
MYNYRNIVIVIFFFLIASSVFFIKSSNIQVEKNILKYDIKCKNCIEYNNIIFSFTDTFNITVSAEGYKQKNFALSHENGFNLINLETKDVEVLFTFNIDPKNPLLFIDQNEIIFGENLFLKTGEYKINFNAENYFDYEKIIDIKPSNEKFTIDISDYFVNKELLFETSEIKSLKLNNDIEIKTNAKFILNNKDNLFSYEDNGKMYEYEFKATNNNFEKLKLDDIFNLKNRGILIETSPSGAAIRINGKYVGLSPTKINENNITKLEISASGHEDYVVDSESLKFDEDIYIELKPILSKVSINSSPPSNIYINKKLISSTPLTIDLPVGSHNISFVKKGYATIYRSIFIDNDYNIKLEEKLLTLKQNALKNSPKKFINDSGIEFILMEPGNITLGSPETELRRMRNEIQRNVKISKHFYVSKHLITEKIYNDIDLNNSGGSNLPKVNIKWIDAAIFANRLSEKENLKQFYNIENGEIISINYQSKGYRLLSEAEWEACASSEYQKTTYPWGNSEIVPPFAGNLAGEENKGKLKYYIENFRDEFQKRSNVGSFKENDNGLTDILGNTSEWVNDFYSEDFLSTTDNQYIDYLGPNIGNSHVVKGSNYESTNQTELGTSYRVGVIGPSELVGFRVARWIY